MTETVPSKTFVQRKSVDIFKNNLDETKGRKLLTDYQSTDVHVAIVEIKKSSDIYKLYPLFCEKIDSIGNILFKYIYEELKSPYGLALDKVKQNCERKG